MMIRAASGRSKTREPNPASRSLSRRPAAFDGLFFGRKGFQLEFEPFHRFFGKRIRQAISDVLDGAGHIDVREVASRPPPILNRPSIFGVYLAALAALATLAALAALAALGPPRPSAGW